MSTREIFHDAWIEFFQSFSTDHLGWSANVTVEGRRNNHMAGTMEGRELPLRSIIANGSGHPNTVVITIGGRGDDLLTHEVEKVAHVRLTEADNKSGSTVRLETTNGQATILTVIAPAPITN